MTEITPLIKVCLIERLPEDRALAFLEKNGAKMSASTYYRYKKEYENTIGDRFLNLMRTEWAEEHLLVLDIIKRLEGKYWAILKDCDNPMDAKHILDSIRATQGEKLMIYNDTPFLTKMREIFEQKLKELPEPKKKKELKKSET